MLPVACPHCGQDLFERNAGWKRIVDLYVSLKKVGKVPENAVIYVDQDTEYELQSLGAWEIGERLASTVMTSGVRDAFITIFGHRVKWDSPRLEIV